LAPLLDNDLRRIKVAHSILLTCVGSPVLYYGDEIGMGDNIWLDDRNGVRTPMQWTSDANAGFSVVTADRLYAPVIDNASFGYQHVNVAAKRADPQSLFNWLKHALRVRKAQPAFGQGELKLLPTANPAVLTYWRIYQDDRVLVINNLSDQDQPIELPDQRKYRDLLSNSLITHHASLQPYQFLWLHPSEA
jgi:maltose alpha-D-glucosyltransferase/alpha-amylase